MTKHSPTAVILFGAPAAGKDTITAALTVLDSRFRLYRKVKVGPGRQRGYRMAELRDAHALERAGVIVSQVQRYGSRYIVDSAELARLFRGGFTPVIHTADTTEFIELTTASWFRGIGIHLFTDRDEASRRLSARDPLDLPRRLAVWDRINAELRANPIDAEAEWDTTGIPATESARRIYDLAADDPAGRAVVRLVRRI